MSELVSVVIPMHNSALDIEKCINSILGQTYKQLELILVDDGSVDETLKICRRLANKEKRIRIFHQENEGPVSARKKGIMNAKGKYISFVDSDDWLDCEMYENMVQVMEQNEVDVVCTGYNRDTGTSSAIVYEKMTSGYYEMTKEDIYKEGVFIDEVCAERKISSSLCTKLFKRGLIADIFMRVDNKMCYAEDVAVVYVTLTRANAIYIMKEAYYHYVDHEESIVNSKNKYLLEQLNLVSEFLEQEFSAHLYSHYLMRQKDLIIADCLFKGLNSSFFDKSNVMLPTYMLPEFEINSDMVIGIYGSGKVGKCYFQQLRSSGYEKVVMIDQKVSKIDESVLHPEEIDCHKIDVILIGVREQNIAMEIEKELKELYGIPQKMMVWKAPVPLLRMCKVEID